MSNINITNEEFKELLKMAKRFADSTVTMPSNRGKATFKLVGKNHREKFYLDINRSGIIELSKFTLQNRYIITPLVRLDIDSGPHMNPDGKRVSRNHIHIYREGYGDSWAYELKDIKELDAQNCSAFNDYLLKFCKYCNILLPQAQLVM